MAPTWHLEPGVVRAYTHDAAAILDVGRWPGGTDDVDEAVAAAFRASGFESVARPDIRALEVRQAAAQPRQPGRRPVPTRRRRLRRARPPGPRRGCRPCSTRPGSPTRASAEDRARRGDILRIIPIDDGPGPGASTWQSLAAGLPVEVDHLNGEIVLLGRLHGVPTPVNEMLQAADPRRRRRPHGPRLDPRRHPPRPPLTAEPVPAIAEAARSAASPRVRADGTGARCARSRRGRAGCGRPPSRPWPARCGPRSRRRSSTRCTRRPTGAPPNVITRRRRRRPHDGVAGRRRRPGGAAGSARRRPRRRPSTTSTARSSCSGGSANRAPAARCTSAWNSGDAPGTGDAAPNAGADEQPDGHAAVADRRQVGGRGVLERRRDLLGLVRQGDPRLQPGERRRRRPGVVGRALGVGDAGRRRSSSSRRRARCAARRRSSRGARARRRTGRSPSPARRAGAARRRRRGRAPGPRGPSGRRR